MAIPLSVKSQFSVGRGVVAVETLVARAAAMGLPGFALTDVDSLSAQPLFHDLCQRHGIRAITGVELEGVAAGRPVRIVAVARGPDGYRSLCRIVSRRRGGAGSPDEQHAARDPVEAVAAHGDGLIVMSDDAVTLARLVESGRMHRDAVRALLARPPRDGAESALIAAAASLGVRVAADAAPSLARPEDAALALLLDAIGRGVAVDESRVAAAAASAAREPVTVAHPATLFADVPEAIAESERIAAESTLVLARGAPVLPGAETFGRAPPMELAARCEAALSTRRARGQCMSDAYAEQLTKELDIIGALGYAGYFLAAAEVAAGARELEIPLAPRGSAVASLVLHLLGISVLDPLEHGLVFERFLHAHRTAPPDIDLDVCSRRREELIRRCYTRFGRARVALVGAHHRYGVPGALRDGLGAVGVPAPEIERIGAALARHGNDARSLAAERPARALPCRVETLETALGLVGLPRLLAMHPGGTVIAPVPIDELVPIERAARDFTVAQYDATAIEVTGLTKLDLLGNRFLTQLGDALELASRRGTRQTRPPPARAAGAALAEIPLDDAATLAALDRADTIGCFQVETPALRALLKQLPIRRLDDCANALALVRPGAAAGFVKREYVRRAHEGASASREGRNAAPGSAGAAGATGTPSLILYDEDLMRMLSQVAGMPLDEADRLRTALIEAGAREREALGAQFRRRAASHGREPAAAAAWRGAVAFAAYSFCKAHALSYALMAFQAVYLKQHHATELGCALLRSYGGAYPLRTIAADLVRHGVTILPPSVNRSAAETDLELDEDGAVRIRVGLEQIKHLTRRSVSAILAGRARSGDFATLAQLLGSVRLARRELAALVRSGACDELAPLSAEAYPVAHEDFLSGRVGDPRDARAAGARDARIAGEHDARAALAARASGPASVLVRIQNELEHFGMHLAAHPLALLRGEARRHGCMTSAEIEAAPERSRVRFAGIVAASRRHAAGTSAGRTMFLTLEDELGLLDTVIPPSHYAELARRVTTPGPYLVDGTVRNDFGRVTVSIAALIPFHERNSRVPRNSALSS